MLFALHHLPTQQMLTFDAYPAGECSSARGATLSYAEPVMKAGLNDTAPPLLLREQHQAEILIREGELVIPSLYCSLIILSPEIDRTELEAIIVHDWARKIGSPTHVATR
jgi:hypothetical protein